MNHRKVISPTSRAGLLALLAAVAVLAAVLTSTPMATQAQAPAVTGVSVQPGANAGPGKNSRLSFSATRSGTHYVSVGGTRPDRGLYRLEVRDSTDDYAADPSTTGVVAAERATERKPNTIGGHGNESEGTDSDGNEQQTFSNYVCGNRDNLC